MDEQLVSKVKDSFIDAGHKVAETAITTNGRLGIIGFKPNRRGTSPDKLVLEAGAVPIQSVSKGLYRGYRVIVFRRWGQIGDAP